MKSNRHPTKVELVQLLDNESEDFALTKTTEHLKRCETCQQELDSLAAQPDQWKKALQFLKESANGGSLSDMGLANPQDTNEKHNEAETWQHSFTELLDPPKHPEMLGRIGEYDIECVVGRGGMGVVFKAYDSKLHRPVAIKVLAPHLANNGTARKRFAQEAIAAAGVIHPNVIAVHGVNDQGKTPFMVMPFVDGISLQALVENRGPLAEANIVRIALQISAGLVAAHSQGLVHRDIKPANILVEAEVNRVVITDFGLARAVDDASLTQTGWLTGTPNYMSPEQACGQRPDHRSDLFSLGSLLYFLATGRLPFRSDTPLGVLTRIQNESPTPVRQVNGQVSETLSDLIDCLLAKHPDDRFQTAAELHDVLEKHLAHLHQPDLSPPPKINFGPKRNWRSTQAKKRLKQILKFCLWSFLAFIFIGNLIFWSFFAGLSRQWTMQWSAGDATSYSLNNSNRDPDGKLLIENATNFLAMKRYDEAIELFQEAAKFPNQAALAHYNLGCVWALTGDPEKAFIALSLAIDSGFEQAKLFQTDDDLNSLRGDPRFKKLLQRLK